MAERDPSGLAGQGRRLLATVGEALQLRYELFALEAREEKVRIVRLVVDTIVAATAWLLFAICFHVLLIIRLWPYKYELLAGLSMFYFLVGVTVSLTIRRRLRHSPTPFASTLEELRKDSAAFTTKS